MGQIQTIKSEIDDDPLGRGYSTMSNIEVADSLNVENRSKNLTHITGDQLGDAVDETEYNALSADDQGAVRELWQVQQLNPFGFAAIVIKSIFPSPGTTLAALVSLRIKSISRGDEIGLKETVQADHITKARAL